MSMTKGKYNLRDAYVLVRQRVNQTKITRPGLSGSLIMHSSGRIAASGDCKRALRGLGAKRAPNSTYIQIKAIDVQPMTYFNALQKLVRIEL